MILLSFTKVGPASWTAWHRGNHYVVQRNHTQRLPYTFALNGKPVQHFESPGPAVAFAHAYAEKVKSKR